MPTRKLISPTIGSTIAPHSCISTRQSLQRNWARPRKNRPALKAHSPTSQAISLISVQMTKVVLPTKANKSGRPRGWAGGFAGFFASSCASRSAPGGKSTSWKALPFVSHQARASRMKSASELSHAPSSSACSRIRAGGGPTIRRFHAGLAAVICQSPPTRTVRVSPSSEVTARAAGEEAADVMDGKVCGATPSAPD